MKPVLGIDITEDKNNLIMNDVKFIVQTPSEMLQQRLEKSMDNAEEVVEKAKLPLVLTIIKGVCGVAAVAIAAGMIESLEDTSLTQMYQRAPWLIWIGVAGILVWAVLEVLSRKKAKEVMETDESKNTLSSLEKVKESIFTELSVPASAKEVDLLSFFYKVKEDKIKVCRNPMQTAQYFNSVYKVYTDAENLYLTNLDAKHSFPLSSLRTIRTVNKRVVMDEWYKDEPYNKGQYKPYKIALTRQGEYTYKGYHILELELDGELWGIYFPSYELPIFEEITGLKAE